MKIMIATDGSEYSKAAIESVGRRNWPAEASFLIFTVAEPLISHLDPILVPYENEAVEDLRALHVQIADSSAKTLRSLRPEADVQVAVATGNAAEQIVQKSKEWGADFIVLGSHGKSGLERFLLGSVAETVVSKATCSVEVIKLDHAKHANACSC